MAKPKPHDDEALKAFMALSDDEQHEAIDRVLDDIGMFDADGCLRDNWQEILRAYKLGRVS